MTDTSKQALEDAIKKAGSIVCRGDNELWALNTVLTAARKQAALQPKPSVDGELLNDIRNYLAGSPCDKGAIRRKLNIRLLKHIQSQDRLNQGWQPIETAPRDGSHVQLYRYDIHFVGYYADAGWCMQGCKLIDPAPTHWMPLPQPPQSEDE